MSVRALKLITVLLVGMPSIAQSVEKPAPPPATQPASATQPAGADVVMSRVIDLEGDVQHTAIGTDDWAPCALDDEYPPETIIRTGLRSSIKLQMGVDDTYTAVVIESATQSVISEAFRTQDTKRIRIGVGYGRVRAGVVEGGLKSDFTVDSPVATLSKRGTWDFGLFYERGTGRFEVFLLDQGLVDAFSKITGERRTVLPQEVVTDAMRRWGQEAQIRKNVPVPDIFGQGEIDVAFNTLRTDGLRVLGPQSGRAVLVDLSSSASQAAFASAVRDRLGPIAVPRVVRSTFRPEGYFGTGRGDQLISILVAPGSALDRQGAMKPGRYQFRRAALEHWLNQVQRR